MGAITKGTELQIVDENDLKLPTNEIGIVRYRTTAQPENYFNQSPNEISAFRNGWFYSGDRGLINDEGHLILHGRESEIINAGGIKIDPAKIDSVALTVHGVKDACAFAVEGKLGITEIALALVLEDGFDRKNFIETLTQNLGKLIPSIIIQVQEIPRTHSGKPLRGELADFYLDTQKRK